MAQAIADSADDGHAGVVGVDIADPYNNAMVLVPNGARLAATPPNSSKRSRARKRKAYADLVRRSAGPDASEPVRMLMYPRGTALAVPCSREGKDLAGDNYGNARTQMTRALGKITA